MKKELFTRDRSFYRTFFPLLIVITLQQLAALTVNLVDNLMLGSYTELALSGSTLVNQLQFILQQIVAGIGMGVSVLGSQYWGKEEISPIRRISSVGLKFSIATGLLFFILTSAAPEFCLRLFTNETEVIAEGILYLNIMRWTYLIFAISNVLMYSLQSVETAFIGTIMSISTIIINMCLNYCFIFGNFGAPELGIRGAAVATLTSRCVELLIILIYIFFIDKKLKFRPKHLINLDFAYLKDFAKAALPVMVSGALWGVAQGAQTAVLGHMSATVIAANSIASVIFQIFVVVGMASASAGSVTMGKTVGEGKLDKVRPYSRTLQMIFLIIGVVSAIAMFLFRNAIVNLYSVSEEAKALAKTFLVILSISTVGTCYEYPVEGGIIAGGGNPKYQAIVDTLFMWLFTIPVSALAAFVFDASPVVVFCLLKADQIIKCIPNGIVCNRYKWVKQLTREEA
ncbi:MAG: MATE family efflux transporter [Oscillospiraceae bacterium]|nr:MATE family efflux transporter [Oscillospiraceae bacterium]